MAGFYAKHIELALKASHGISAFPTGTLKGAFMATSYVQNKETHQYWADISASIASGTTVRTLTGAAVTIDTVNDRVEADIDNPTETPVTASTNQFVTFIDTGGATSTWPLLECVDITTTLSPVGGTLTLTVNAEGLAAINY